MINVAHTELTVDGITVRIDTLDNGNSGFGYRIGDRAYTQGGFDTAAAARRCAPGHVRRALRSRERAAEANAKRARSLRVIGSKA